MIYLASPYTHENPAVRQTRFEQVCRATAYLMRRGHHVFSPIAHSHPVAEHGALPTDFGYWEAYDREMIHGCAEVWVLRLDGWESSRGVAAEIALADELDKPIRYLDLCYCGTVHEDGVPVHEARS